VEKMIIDIHTHTPQFKDAVPADKVVMNNKWRPDRTVKATTSWDDYFEGQKPAERSVVFNIAWHPGHGHDRLAGGSSTDTSWYEKNGRGNYNDATATFVRAFPDKLIGFMALHPFDADVMDEFERCRTDLNMKGVKLGANYQIFDPLETRALAIYEAAQKHNLPVLFHNGTSPVRTAPIRYAHPLLTDEIAIRYPDLKIIMAHLGHPWQVDTAVVVRKHPNVYTDMSANFYRPFSFWEQMIKAREWNITDKILFGTDFPVTNMQESIDAFRNINSIVEGTKLPRFPEEIIEEIIHRDSLAMLGLS
jgi:predicted TIM-barrel fold metal-dependent hydrolase